MHQLTVDVNDQVAVSFIELLQHLKLSFCHSERSEEPPIRGRDHANNLTNQMTSSMMYSKEMQVNLRRIVRSLACLRGLGMTMG
jgi:hypothetical protein